MYLRRLTKIMLRVNRTGDRGVLDSQLLEAGLEVEVQKALGTEETKKRGIFDPIEDHIKI